MKNAALDPKNVVPEDAPEAKALIQLYANPKTTTDKEPVEATWVRGTTDDKMVPPAPPAPTPAEKAKADKAAKKAAPAKEAAPEAKEGAPEAAPEAKTAIQLGDNVAGFEIIANGTPE